MCNTFKFEAIKRPTNRYQRTDRPLCKKRVFFWHTSPRQGVFVVKKIKRHRFQERDAAPRYRFSNAYENPDFSLPWIVLPMLLCKPRVVPVYWSWCYSFINCCVGLSSFHRTKPSHTQHSHSHRSSSPAGQK